VSAAGYAAGPGKNGWRIRIRTLGQKLMIRVVVALSSGDSQGIGEEFVAGALVPMLFSDLPAATSAEMSLGAASRSACATGYGCGGPSCLFQGVIPAASANCVSPATLLTPSFFIIVLR